MFVETNVGKRRGAPMIGLRCLSKFETPIGRKRRAAPLRKPPQSPRPETYVRVTELITKPEKNVWDSNFDNDSSSKS